MALRSEDVMNHGNSLTGSVQCSCDGLLPRHCLACRRVVHVNAPSVRACPHVRGNAGGGCARGPLAAGCVSAQTCPKAAWLASGHVQGACVRAHSAVQQEPEQQHHKLGCPQCKVSPQMGGNAGCGRG